MADYTVYSEANDYYVRSKDPNWGTARSGADLIAAGDTLASIAVGSSFQFGTDYLILDGLFAFDASAVPAGTDSSIILSLTVSSNSGAAGASLEVYAHTWTSGTASWVAGADRGALAIAGTTTTGTGVRTASLSSLPRSLYKLMVSDQRVRTNVTPGTLDGDGTQISFHSANASGTTNDPKITLTVETGTAYTGNATLEGVGALSALAQRSRGVAAVLAGASALAVSAALAAAGSANLTGAGTLSAVASQTGSLSASLIGVGTLAANAVRGGYAGAVLTGTGTLTATSTATSFLSASLSGVGVLSARYLTAPEQYTPGLFIPREAPQWFVNVARSIEEGLRLNRMPEVSTVADLPDVRENRAAQFLVTDLRMVVVSNGADWIRLDTGVSV